MRYYLIAGEASGDLHGSNLIKGLISEDPQAQFRFWGGELMQQAAGGQGELVHHYKEGAVMGLSDVLSKAGKLLGNLRSCKSDILAYQPDLVILIDYPGFNMKIASFCHSHAIKVYYYIAPKTWASRSGRNSKLRKSIDKLYLVFPFEIPYFSKHGVPFEYEGNPLLDAIEQHSYSRPAEGKYIAILAGSRKGEISRTMPIAMQAVDALSKLSRYKDYQFLVAGAPARSEQDYLRHIGERSNVRLIFGRSYDILKYADCAMVNSGTASLEAALIGTPQVVVWNTSRTTFFIAKHILRIQKHIKYISLGNLCIDSLAFRELIQDDFSCANVAAELDRLSGDAGYRADMLDAYAQIRKSLGGSGASRKVARSMILSLTED